MYSSFTSTNSDPSRRIPSSSSSTRPQPFRRDSNARILGGYDGYSPGAMTVEGILHETFASDPLAAEESSLLMDSTAPTPMEVVTVSDVGKDTRGKSVDEVWREIAAFGNSADVYGGARGKRVRVMMEPLDKAAAQRQRRMIKNCESAARSRERKQAYQVELETLASKLEEENEKLSVEIEDKRKERYQSTKS